MAVEIELVNTKKQLKQFVKVPFEIYKGNKLWVPPLIRDEMNMFNPRRNPSYENAQTKLFIAYKNGKAVGRIAGILSVAANQKYQTKNLRFGWFDTITDYEVAHSLFAALEQWAVLLGMETITGPHGFSDLDPQGMLVEGFDYLPTIAVIYNFPYYPEFTEQYGFKKDVDYVEFRSLVPAESGIPPRLQQMGPQIRERTHVTIIKFKNRLHLMERAHEIFQLLQETFAQIYGSIPLTQKQMEFYIKKYIAFADKDLIQLAVDENDVPVGFMITMPSLSVGYQKARGHLFPFGLYHIFRARRNYKVLDFYLAGVKEKYRGHGVDILMALEIVDAAIKKGVQQTESNPELETNKKIQAQWKYFNPTQHKRRRIFIKQVNKAGGLTPT